LIVERGRVSGLRRGEASAVIPGYELAWRGVAYYPGKRPGPAAIAAALSGAGPDPMVDTARYLRGNFFLSIRDVVNGRTVAFTDSGGMFDAYVSGARVATSFIQLAETIGARRGDVDPAAVVEFLDLGKVYEGRTLLKDIRRLLPGTVYELRDGEQPLVHHLGMPGIDASPAVGFTLQQFFEELAASLAGLNVSVDLTGGSDTRLVAAMLARSLPFECAVSGTANSSDVEIATEVARALGRPLHVTIHDLSDVGDVAGELFEAADGISDLLTWHRLRQFARERADRHIDIAVGGIGGEFLKDYFWLIDFPFYRSRALHLERVFDARFRSVAFPRRLLADRFVRHAADVRPRILTAMRQRRMATNTETYDRIYYEMRMAVVAAHAISVNDNYVPFVAPLLDPAVVRLGYSLPRRDRVFNRYHRRLITDASLAVARVPSSDTHITRMSLSSRPRDELRDAPAYVLDKIRRLATKVGQRFGMSGGYPPLDDQGLIPAARSSDAFQRAVESLVSGGVLSPAARGDLPDRHVGTVMTLGMLFERLDT
jgi:asparagine synthetase B (glutamine-hydrolysing)